MRRLSVENTMGMGGNGDREIGRYWIIRHARNLQSSNISSAALST